MILSFFGIGLGVASTEVCADDSPETAPDRSSGSAAALDLEFDLEA